MPLRKFNLTKKKQTLLMKVHPLGCVAHVFKLKEHVCATKQKNTSRFFSREVVALTTPGRFIPTTKIDCNRLHVGPWHSSVAPRNGWMRHRQIGGKKWENDGFFPGRAIEFGVIKEVHDGLWMFIFDYLFSFMDKCFWTRFQTGYLPLNHRRNPNSEYESCKEEPGSKIHASSIHLGSFHHTHYKFIIYHSPANDEFYNVYSHQRCFFGFPWKH